MYSSRNKVEAVRQFVQTVCIFEFKNVTNRELDLLCELIRCGGVNDKAKRSFIVNYQTSKENYGQLVKRLADKKILESKDGRNGKVLSPLLITMLDLYINNTEANYLGIQWKIEA